MPVFAYKPGAKGRTAAPDNPVPPSYERVNEDPFTVDSSLSVEMRQSWLIDGALWAAQFISECADKARTLHTLKKKLEDPALADNPHRVKAVHRAEELHEDLIQHARDAVWTIAEGDRYWRSLTPEQRAPVAGHWHVDAEAPSLVTIAWVNIAARETWPKRFRLHRMMFNDFPWPLILELNASGFWTWDPSPGPPDPWPDHDHMPLKVAMELERRTR